MQDLYASQHFQLLHSQTVAIISNFELPLNNRLMSCLLADIQNVLEFYLTTRYLEIAKHRRSICLLLKLFASNDVQFFIGNYRSFLKLLYTCLQIKYLKDCRGVMIYSQGGPGHEMLPLKPIVKHDQDILNMQRYAVSLTLQLTPGLRAIRRIPSSCTDGGFLLIASTSNLSSSRNQRSKIQYLQVGDMRLFSKLPQI